MYPQLVEQDLTQLMENVLIVPAICTNLMLMEHVLLSILTALLDSIKTALSAPTFPVNALILIWFLKNAKHVLEVFKLIPMEFAKGFHALLDSFTQY